MRKIAALAAVVALATGAPAQDAPAGGTESSGREVGLSIAELKRADEANRFQLGIEMLEIGGLRPLLHRRVLLVTGRDAVTQDGRTTYEILAGSRRTDLVRVGVVRTDDRPGSVPGALDAQLAAGGARPSVPVDAAMLADEARLSALFEGIEVVVVDHVPMGARWRPSTALIHALVAESGRRNVPLVLLDRPPLADASVPRGPMPTVVAPGHGGRYPLPPIPGLTGGEYARLLNEVFGLQAPLTVIPMSQWSRRDGNAWLGHAMERAGGEAAPAELRRLAQDAVMTPRYGEALLVYDLIETLRPPTKPATFEFGAEGASITIEPTSAPASSLMPMLEKLRVRGASFELVPPDGAPESGERIRIRLAPDGEAADPVEVALAVLGVLCVSGECTNEGTHAGLFGNPSVFDDVRSRRDPDSVTRQWASDAAFGRYMKLRESVLLYP